MPGNTTENNQGKQDRGRKTEHKACETKDYDKKIKQNQQTEI